MEDVSALNCPYCEKKYDNRGWLPKHIKQHHENSFLLDNNMTVLKEAGHDESCLEAEFNNPDNTIRDEHEQVTHPKISSSTPSPPPMVPLCQNANKYIIKRGNTLPASFLTTLLPAPGFLDMLNDSLQTPASPQIEALHSPASSQLGVLQGTLLNVEEVMCEECGKLFEDENLLRTHLNIEHDKKQVSVVNGNTTYKCEDCEFRTQMAVDLFHHNIYEHNPEAPQITREIKPVDPAVIYLLAEQNMVLGEEVKKLHTQVKSLMEKSKSDTSVMCNKCQDKLTYPTRLQEHLRKEHSCMTCKQSFKTEKKKKKIKYLCETCNKSYHQKDEFQRHTESTHPEQHDKDVKFTCTECDYTEKTEKGLVKHMEYTHPSMFSPHKVEILSPTKNQLKCLKCDHLGDTEDNLFNHMENTHFQKQSTKPIHKKNTISSNNSSPLKMFSKNTREITAILGDSITHNINTAELERKTATFIHLPGRKGSAGAKTRRCYTARRGKRFPENNFCEKLPIILNEAKVDNLILQASANDITNLKEETNMEEAQAKAKESSRLMIHLANRATSEYPQIKKVIILTRPPRLDTLSELSEVSNSALKEEVKKYNNDKISVIEHNIALQGLTKEDVYGVKSERNDGIHMNGKHGKQAYTNSLIHVLQSCGISKKKSDIKLN